MKKVLVGPVAKGACEILDLSVTSDWACGIYRRTLNRYRKISRTVLWHDTNADKVCRYVTYTLSPWQPEKVLAIGSWMGSSLAMLRGGFLSAKERTALQAVMRHPSEIHGVARRANAILLLDDGWNCAKVAEALYLDDDRVLTWFKRYQAGGLDEMTVFDWKGRSGDLSRERMAELSARLGERLMRDSGEVAAYIAA